MIHFNEKKYIMLDFDKTSIITTLFPTPKRNFCFVISIFSKRKNKMIYYFSIAITDYQIGQTIKKKCLCVIAVMKI